MKRVRTGKQFGRTIGRVVVSEPSDAPKRAGRPRSLEVLALNVGRRALTAATLRPPRSLFTTSIKLENVTINMLGRAKKVTVEKENTTIVSGAKAHVAASEASRQRQGTAQSPLGGPR